MLRFSFVLATCALMSGAAHAQYKPGWNAKNFYSELNTCRSSIVSRSTESYERRDLSAGRSADAVRNELIAITPASDYVASAACFCALNELAKGHAVEAVTADKTLLVAALKEAKCKEAWTKAIEFVRTNRSVDMRLK